MKTSRLILLLALLAIVHPVSAADPSPEIKQVLQERMRGEHDLKLDGLTKAKITPEQSKRLEDKSAYEVFHVPYPKNTADHFSYSIYPEKEN